MIGANDALKRFLTDAPPGDWWIDVLELSHPAWSQSYVLANNQATTTVTFEDGRRVDAQPVGFSVDLPDAGTQGRQDMAITMDNVGAELWFALEQAQAQPKFSIAVTWRVYLNSQRGAPAANPLRLAVVSVTATLAAVQMLAQRSDSINARFPRVLYRPDRWPGLAR